MECSRIFGAFAVGNSIKKGKQAYAPKAGPTSLLLCHLVLCRTYGARITYSRFPGLTSGANLWSRLRRLRVSMLRLLVRKLKIILFVARAMLCIGGDLGDIARFEQQHSHGAEMLTAD